MSYDDWKTTEPSRQDDYPPQPEIEEDAEAPTPTQPYNPLVKSSRKAINVDLDEFQVGAAEAPKPDLAKIQVGTMEHALRGYADGCECEPCRMLREHLTGLQSAVGAFVGAELAKRLASRPSVSDQKLHALVSAKEPNGYPLWFNREVAACKECDPEDLCARHWSMAMADFKGYEYRADDFIKNLTTPPEHMTRDKVGEDSQS